MADNITAGGNVVATDEVGSVHYQRIKLMHGADGSATDVSSASPLPVADAAGLVQLQAIVAALGGTLTVDQAALLTALANLLTELQAKADLNETQPVSLATLPDTAGGDLAAMAAQLSGTLQTAVSSVAIPSAIYSGQKTVTAAGTAEALAVSQALVSGVTVKALADNTDLIYVGSASVDSSSGFALAAGEQVFVEIDDVAKIYVDAAVSGDGVSWLAA